MVLANILTSEALLYYILLQLSFLSYSTPKYIFKDTFFCIMQLELLTFYLLLDTVTKEI